MADNNSEEKLNETDIDPAKLRAEINAENEDQREAMMKGVYAGPDAMSMMMVYAGPVQMQNRGGGLDFAQFMSAYAGPAPDGTIQGSMAAMMRQGGINPQPKPQPRKETYCFCPACGALCTLIYCPECGTLLKDVQRYKDCRGCGARLVAAAKFCSECGSAQPSDDMMKA